MRICASLVLLLSACSLTAICSTTYTGASSSGQDTTDWNKFLSDNSSLSFSNITFSNGAWTTGPGGSVIDTATGSNFIGCLSNWSDCTSNSSVTVTTLGNWDGGGDPALSGPAANGVLYSTITVDLPSNVFAIGLDILNVNANAGVPYGVIVNGGSQFVSPAGVSLPGSVFFGYSSASAITSLTVFAEFNKATIGLDNVDVGFLAASGGGGAISAPLSTAPEASTMLLVAFGLFTLGFARKLPRLTR
ncbi:MAG TPA: hypothetical protein VKV74_13290 [Bryobacteraceae bacterium]|nr:hypothetical protein [Bryobacteraceae bacterium]